jgi:hypothetical protein
MSASAGWEREARTFARYVVGGEASPWLVERYARAHDTRPQLRAATTFDRWQAWLAARHPIATLLMDGPGRFVAPRSLLRRKLILVTALLEVAPGAHRWFDGAPGGVLRQGAHLVARGALLIAVVLVGLPILAALWTVAFLAGGRR